MRVRVGGGFDMGGGTVSVWCSYSVSSSREFVRQTRIVWRGRRCHSLDRRRWSAWDMSCIGGSLILTL